MGQTSSLSVFQVKSPPSKNLNEPSCSSRTTLFLLSEVSAGLVVESEQSGLGLGESAAGMNRCFAARHCKASLAAPSVCLSAIASPGLITTRLSVLNSRYGLILARNQASSPPSGLCSGMPLSKTVPIGIDSDSSAAPQKWA